MGYKVGFDTNSEIHKETKSNVPKWRICTRGINLIGICRNEGCEAKDKQVVIQMPGKTEYDFIQKNEESTNEESINDGSINENQLICPVCKKPIEKTNNVVFYKCRFKFKGRKLDLETYEEGEEEEREGDSWNGHTVFNPVSPDEKVDDDRWLELKVTVEIRKD